MVDISFFNFYLGSCSKLIKLFKVTEGKFKIMDFEVKVGLNAQTTFQIFPCLLDEVSRTFYIWLGDITIEKFNKSTFMNLTNYAEENNAKKMVIV
jgi:hypothetical protein